MCIYTYIYLHELLGALDLLRVHQLAGARVLALTINIHIHIHNTIH